MLEYTLLSPYIREYIYNKNWSELKFIQAQAIRAVLQTNDNILITAGTASGKTEAAFFPILTDIQGEIADSISVLYIGPLKALINDQFNRLEELLEIGGVKINKWHGDVFSSVKQNILENPSGILQITPESLESLLIRHSRDVPKLFGKLMYVIIDEVHAFMGTDRGNQLLCQILRIETIIKHQVRRIGLSATLGDVQQAADWLGCASNFKTSVISDTNTTKKIKLLVDWQQHDLIGGNLNSYYNSIYKYCYNKKSIIFTNRRSDAEEIVTNLRKIAGQRKEPDVFHVHHGSISRTLRTEAENFMRIDKQKTVTAATSTLELGIDIGELERIIQIDAPFTCSSFVQRLGRSGRRNNVSEMYFIGTEKKDSINPLESLPIALIQMIAIISLYTEERWIEPIYDKPLPYSLLYHQTMSLLTANGELTAGELAKSILTMPVFRNISQDDYKILLSELVQKEHIQKIDNKVIIGLAGEQIVNNYSFFSVFADENEFNVIFDGKSLGNIPQAPPINSIFMLAGKTWIVNEVDFNSKQIYAEPANGVNSSLWHGKSGNIHTNLVQRMRKVLSENTDYPYLSENARIRLQEARESMKNLISEDIITVLNEKQLLMSPWLGTKSIKTLNILLSSEQMQAKLKIKGYTNIGQLFLIINTEMTPKELLQNFNQILSDISDLTEFIDKKRIPFTDKFDYLLPKELLLKSYVNNQLDLNEIKHAFIPL